MGASDFFNIAVGPTMGEAFSIERESVAWESGHGGYTGTLAEKGGARLVGTTGNPERLWTLLEEAEMGRARRNAAGKYVEVRGSREKARAALTAWLQRYGTVPLSTLLDLHRDKWSDAIAVEVTGKRAVEIKKRRNRAGTRDKVFAFMGYASS